MARIIADEACLHYESSERPLGTTWGQDCRTLFDARGTFVSIFGGRATTPPAVEPFSIAVGCRFRPPGGVSGPAREMVLPLHQRLRLIQQSLGCSLAEARRQLFTSQGQAILADPWSVSNALFVAPPAPPPAAADPADDKENCANTELEAVLPSVADAVDAHGCGAPTASAEGVDAPASVSDNASVDVPDDSSGDAAAADGGAHRASTGLIALHGSSAIICAPGAGIRAFDFVRQPSALSLSRSRPPPQPPCPCPRPCPLRCHHRCLVARASTHADLPGVGAPRALAQDHAWGEDAAQEEVYAAAVHPLVRDVLNGKSACVLAYGQTGSGKTHTMTGPGLVANAPEARGVVPRAVASLFDACAERKRRLGVTSKVSLACIEVYGELVSDLLHDRADGAATAGVGGFWAGVTAAATAAGHADEVVGSYEEAISLLETADGAKRRAATAMNERSSRAHSLIVITLEQEAREGEGRLRSTLCLVDLGGCEKVKKSHATGERLQEAIHINQGLLALKSVITALNQHRSYVPYQDSKLTYLLKRSLAGGARTYVLLAARPEAEHAMETCQALRFGETCAQIEVAAHNGAGAGRAAALALESLDARIAELEAAIRAKERFETRIETVTDERAGLLDAAGFGSTLTDLARYEKKVSVIVGAEKERAQLEKVLASRRALVFGE